MMMDDKPDKAEDKADHEDQSPRESEEAKKDAGQVARIAEPTISQDNRLKLFWRRLADRSKPPRSWWYPLPPKREFDAEALPDLHKECSETIRRAMMALLAFSLFCLLAALGANDRLLLGAQAEINIPFANVRISFIGFVVVAPLLLIVLSIYLHIFVAHLREIEAAMTDVRMAAFARRLPTIFNIDATVPRRLTAFIFYWLVPLVLAAITWKAMGVPHFGLMMTILTVFTALSLLFLQIRRSQTDNRRKLNPMHWLGMALIIGAAWFIHDFRRPLNLFRADFRNAYLADVDLQGADLGGATLEAADLSDADLSEAGLSFANLTRANLTGANLHGARLRAAELSNASLRAADLSGASLSRANLHGANLSEADLSDASFLIADLSGTNLRGTNLSRANLKGADLQGADLSRANLSGANLLGVKGLTLDGLHKARHWPLAIYSDDFIKHLGFPPNHNLRVKILDLRSYALQQADLSGANLSGADLSGANLSGANLYGADLSGANLSGANLYGASLYGASLYGASLSEADLSEASLAGANLSEADLSGADLRGADLSEASLAGANLSEADLQGAMFSLDIKELDPVAGQKEACEQLPQAKNWQSAYRDEAMACGALIPDPPSRSESGMPPD